MRDGAVVESFATENSEQPDRAPYTQDLINAVPVLARPTLPKEIEELLQ